MSGNRRLRAVGAAAALALIGASSAFAATPQQIYRDVTDNGRMDGAYTRAELERAFNLPPAVRTDAPAAPRKPIRTPAAAESPPPASVTNRSGRRVPFSALDVALLLAGGGPLLLIGAGLRRRMAAPPRHARAASG